MVFGLLEALLISLSVPVKVCPITVGRKVTLSMQLPPTARDAGQLPRVEVNAPPDVTEVIKSAPGPRFITVTFAIVFVLTLRTPKFRAACTDNSGGVMAVPLTGTVVLDKALLLLL